MKRTTPLRRTGIPGRKTPLVSRSQLRRRMILRSEEQRPQAEPGQRREQPLRRRARLRPVNQRRRAARFARAYHSVGFVQWVAGLACVVPGCTAVRCDAAHVRSRAAGGTWREVVPCCRVHHTLWHSIGTRAFEALLPESLESIAAAVALRWMAFTRSDTSAT